MLVCARGYTLNEDAQSLKLDQRDCIFAYILNLYIYGKLFEK